MRTLVATTTLAFLVLVVGPAWAEPDSAAKATPPATATQPATAPAGDYAAGNPVQSIRTIDAEFSGQPKIVSLTITGKAGEPGVATLNNNGVKVVLPADQLVRVQVSGKAAEGDRPSAERVPVNATALLLADGEWLTGLISDGDERQVMVSVVGVGELAVSLRDLRGVVTAGGRAGKSMTQLERTLLTDPPAGGANKVANDVVRLANGEVVSGTVVSITPKGLTVQSALGSVPVSLDVVTMGQLANPLPSPPADAPAAAWVELANGTRLLANTLQWESGVLKLTRAGDKTELTVPEADVLSVEIANGRCRWLDAMTPALSEHRPFLSVHWPARFSTNVAGGPIRIGERAFSHGIGVHSASRLVFDVEKAKAFHCVGGLDASAGPMADVDIQVLLDGKVKFEKKSVKQADGPVAIDLPDLGSAKKLELKVDFGANGDVQDRFDWADAAFVR